MNRIFLLALVVCVSRLVAAETDDQGLPQVPSDFKVTVYAAEPLVRNPCAMAFDVQGRLFVGQGPQYRKPNPDSPTDRVTLLIDVDQDGIADHAKTFAEGFNNIQGLAWYGDQLWIANAPDLTVVRDVDGDDVADEYRRIYGGIGNLEHALHGLSFAPDGWLYMSKGNSKGSVALLVPKGSWLQHPSLTFGECSYRRTLRCNPNQRSFRVRHINTGTTIHLMIGVLKAAYCAVDLMVRNWRSSVAACATHGT